MKCFYYLAGLFKDKQSIALLPAVRPHDGQRVTVFAHLEYGRVTVGCTVGWVTVSHVSRSTVLCTVGWIIVCGGVR